jgi:hypothetical protein
MRVLAGVPLMCAGLHAQESSAGGIMNILHEKTGFQNFTSSSSQAQDSQHES